MLGAYRSTPRSIVAGESGLKLARALLNHRQAMFTQRLSARPRDGPEGILTRERSALTRTYEQLPPSAEEKRWRPKSTALAARFRAGLSSAAVWEATRPPTRGGGGTRCGPKAHELKAGW